MRTLILVVLALVAVGAGEARATMCLKQQTVGMIHPKTGQLAPRNTVIYLTRYSRRRRFVPRLLTVRGMTTQKTVALATLAPTGSGLIRVVPQQPLVALEQYVVRYGKRVLGRFRTLRVSWRAQVPKMAPVTVELVQVRPSGRWDKGHRGLLIFPRGGSRQWPAVVRVDFHSGRFTHYSFGFRSRWVVAFASSISCWRYCWTPSKGSYRVTVTPWSATGQRGKAQVFKGKVRYGPWRPNRYRRPAGPRPRTRPRS